MLSDLFCSSSGSEFTEDDVAAAIPLGKVGTTSFVLVNFTRELSLDSPWIGLDGTAEAFGDGFNDTMMLKTVGMGVAMANAMPEVKKAADRLTDSNDEEGVARFIEKYILKTE